MVEVPAASLAWHKAQKEAAQFVLPDDWQVGRTPVDGITIDDAKARDRDDAIWFLPNNEGGHDITVSIADVGTFVRPHSKMAEHALLLGETRYVRSAPRPMLPRSIGERALSLLDTKTSPTLTYGIRLDNAGQIASTTISRGLIRPMRATYQEVAEYTHAKGDDPRTAIFGAYEQLAIGLLKVRQRSGAFAFYSPEQGIMTDEDGRVIQFEKGVEHSGQLIVQEFMILANAAVGLYMQRHNIPGIFRQHRLAQKIDVQEAVALVQSGQKHYLDVLRAGMGRAWYSVEPGIHEALQLPVYAQSTSALRRFADLANHWNILAHLEGRDYPFSDTELAEIATHLNEVQAELRKPSPHFKEKDARVSAERLQRNPEVLMALPAGEYYRVVKAAVREGMAPAGFQASIAEKIAANALQPEDVATLLCSSHADESWRTLKTTLMKHLAHKPDVATSVLTIALAQEMVDLVTTTPIQGKTGFAWRVEISKDELTVEGNAEHTRNDRARHIAALQALVEFTGIPVTVVEDPVQPGLPYGGSNPKGVLNEYMQAKRQPLPAFSVTTEWTNGTEHLFKATTVIGGQPYSGHGRTKKDAEAAAASEAVQALGIGNSTTAQGEAPLGSNPVSRLAERSAQRRIDEPSYVFSQTGPPHKPTFYCEVTVIDDEGQPRPFQGKGTSKSAAKANAAHVAISYLETPKEKT